MDKEGRAVASSSTEVITTEDMALEPSTSLEPMSDVERPDESPHMPCDVSPLMEECLDESEGTIDLGVVIREANGSWDKLRSLVHHLSDEKKKQYLSFHFKPCQGDTLHSHPVTKKGKTWNVSFQLRWLQDFTWLSYSQLLSGGICRYCVLFPEQPGRGDGLGQGNRSGVLVLTPYQRPYSKALGKDGVLVSHSNSIMHNRATERVDIFLRNTSHSMERIDSRLLLQSDQMAQENKHILSQIVLTVEFLAKQGLPLRVHRDDKVDFTREDKNRDNFIAVLQYKAKSDLLLMKHLISAKRNAKYTSTTIQNQITHIYANKVRENVTNLIRERDLPYTIIADETTDKFANQEILTLCLRFVDLPSSSSSPSPSSRNPRIRECLLSFLHLQRANAVGISKKILEVLSHPSISLNIRKICGQAYDGASVMSSDKAGVQAKIKEVSPMALYTHCYSHYFSFELF